MTDIHMPRLSDTMEEGVLLQWHKQVGDEVHRGDILAEIETDKTTMELEAYDEGVLERLLVAEGDTVPIGEPIAVVGDGSGTDDRDNAPRGGSAAGADREDQPDADGSAPSDTGEEPSGDATVEPAAPRSKGADATSQPAEDDARPSFRSPLARKLARDHDIDLRSVTGTGPGGRIVRTDVEKAIEAGAGAENTAGHDQGGAPTAALARGAAQQAATAHDGDQDIRLNANQRVTAERLTQMAGVPTFQLTTRVDADALLAFRREINDKLADGAPRISVTDLLLRASAVALRAHPAVNASWGGDKIIRRGRVHIGLAVALEAGLIVPVVRDADQKSIGRIAAESRDLATRARDGKLGPDEYQGSTFSISNLGMFGIDTFNAIINPPEAAILAVGTALPEPVLRDGELQNRTVITLTLTVDHRVLNGAVAAAFLQELRGLLEEPLRILV